MEWSSVEGGGGGGGRGSGDLVNCVGLAWMGKEGIRRCECYEQSQG